jgi:hypothetical protein
MFTDQFAPLDPGVPPSAGDLLSGFLVGLILSPHAMEKQASRKLLRECPRAKYDVPLPLFLGGLRRCLLLEPLPEDRVFVHIDLTARTEA